MTEARVRRIPDTYVDSVLLMSATRAMQRIEGVIFASAVMGTEANVRDLRKRGIGGDQLEPAGGSDVVLAVLVDDAGAAEAALEAGGRIVAGRADHERAPQERRPRTLGEAVHALPGANLAIVSVPGDYAALEAHKALTAGLHVLLFSDNVPLEDEVALKRRAAGLGLLLMGPGAGTGWLAGVGLGFANVVAPGPVGVVAAAGTGAQEIMALLDRWGAGLSLVIGVGGRDLSEDVGGIMTRLGIRALEDDAETQLLLLVSKPPAPQVAEEILGAIERRPAVAALVGLRGDLAAPSGVRVARTLEEGALLALEALGVPLPNLAEGLAERAKLAVESLGEERRTIRGLFSGGTLCYESMVVISERLGPVHSNVPLNDEWGLPAPPGAHVCLDLGDEEFTRGRPHPMIDPEPRAEQIAELADDPGVAVALLDVVLGYGAHSDPASVLAPSCRRASERGIVVVAHVLGTDRDPQGYAAQVEGLEDAGCLVAPTGARAALLATAIAARDPEMAEAVP